MANRLELSFTRSAESRPQGRALEPAIFPHAPSARVACANPACSRLWPSFLKDRRRPVFEHGWGCSGKCLRALVDAALRREAGEANLAEPHSAHRHRIPLGLILLSRGWITQAQLQRALESQRHAGRGRIGDWLQQQAGLSPDLITRALGMQWGCPVLPLDGFDPAAMALALPRLFAETFAIVPVRIVADRSLYVSFNDRLDAAATFALERMSGLKVVGGISDPAQWHSAQQRLAAAEFAEARLERIPDVESIARRMASDLTGLQPRASRLVRLHQFYWLRLWLEEGTMRTSRGGLPRTREDVVDRIYTVGREQ